VAREPIPNPIDDQPPACKFADRGRFSVVLPKVHLPPRRYWEEALQEDPADYPIFLGQPHE
jgi:hypothetical protein